jgi:diacylglycerol kinase (ATP)
MKRLVAAFFNSIAGLRFGIRHEAAIRQEFILALLSVPAALMLTLEPWKLLALWSSMLLLLCAELLNTGIEKIADRDAGPRQPRQGRQGLRVGCGIDGDPDCSRRLGAGAV